MQTNLGAIPSGRHTYRIEWHRVARRTQVRYYIDGTLRATHTVGNIPAIYVYASYNSGSAPALALDSLRLTAPPYAGSGSFTSCALDAGSGSVWTG